MHTYTPCMYILVKAGPMSVSMTHMGIGLLCICIKMRWDGWMPTHSNTHYGKQLLGSLFSTFQLNWVVFQNSFAVGSDFQGELELEWYYRSLNLDQASMHVCGSEWFPNLSALSVDLIYWMQSAAHSKLQACCGSLCMSVMWSVVWVYQWYLWPAQV